MPASAVVVSPRPGRRSSSIQLRRFGYLLVRPERRMATRDSGGLGMQDRGLEDRLRPSCRAGGKRAQERACHSITLETTSGSRA